MSAKSKHSVIIASDLRTGRSVYLASDSTWAESIGYAQVLDEEQAESRLEIALNSEANNLVIDPYLISVDSASNALDIREAIRTTGPTVLDNALLDGYLEPAVRGVA